MRPQTLVLIAILCQLSGCVLTPRIEIPQRLSFDQPLPDQAPMSYNDLLCCYECQA
jgi:hypothetical protein